MGQRATGESANGKHTGSEDTSKGSAHFLDHIIQRRERGWKRKYCSPFTPTNIAHNPPPFFFLSLCVWVGGCVHVCVSQGLCVTPIQVGVFSPPEALVAPQMHETQLVLLLHTPHTHTYGYICAHNS